MYIHLGEDVIVKNEDIIGIFDLDTASVEKNTRLFLRNAEKKGQVVNVTYELPKSFCVCASEGGGEPVVYISQISTSTLAKRAKNFYLGSEK